MTSEQLKKLLEDREALQMELRDTQRKIRNTNNELTGALFDFSGSVTDAIRLGLVKPAFSVPPAAMAQIMGKKLPAHI